MPKKEKIEFIESYLKVGNDYQWNDNHGELVRCGNCKFYEHCKVSGAFKVAPEPDWFCADGKKKDDE